MKKKLYIWIIIGLFIIGYNVIMQMRYNSLKQDYNELKIKKENIIDSLKNDNAERLQSIVKLESEIITLNYKVDSLYNVKQKVVQSKKDFTVSKSISESSNLLKRNLNEKNINGSF